MPIDIIGKSTTQLADTKGRSKTQKTDDATKSGAHAGAGNADSTDTVSLTSTATLLQQLERNLDSAPVVDLKHVRDIRDQLERGAYNINPMRVAIKLLSFEFDTRLRAA